MASKAPQKISDILSELMARHGFTRIRAAAAAADAWRQAAGEDLSKQTRLDDIKGGVARVTAVNSLLVQELGYRKTELLEHLRRLLPDERIKDLRFRVGTVGD